jgi:uncharacterized protein
MRANRTTTPGQKAQSKESVRSALAASDKTDSSASLGMTDGAANSVYAPNEDLCCPVSIVDLEYPRCACSWQRMFRRKPVQAKNTYLMVSSAGANRDLSKGSREQLFWDEHAAFIDKLDEEGFILMGGPLVDEGGAVLIVHAVDEQEIREKTKDDPWYVNDILKFESIKRWDIFIDNRK